MLQNWNLINSIDHRIFKSIGFVSSHCVSVINLNATSSFNIFSKFDYVFKSVV